MVQLLLKQHGCFFNMETEIDHLTQQFLSQVAAQVNTFVHMKNCVQMFVSMLLITSRLEAIQMFTYLW